MKKFTSLFLALVICLAFSACGTKEMTLTVTDQEGTVSEMTVAELKNTKKNTAQFDKLYRYAEVSFTGEVTEVKTNYTINGSKAYDSISFKGGITLYVDHSENTLGALLGNTDRIYDYSEINIGDKLVVEGARLNDFFGEVNLFSCEKLVKAE